MVKLSLFFFCSSCVVGLTLLLKYKSSFVVLFRGPWSWLSSRLLLISGGVRLCQEASASWDVWSLELNVLVTRALFSFITWHLLLKGRTKGEIQRSHGECSKNGTLRTATLSHKWSWKTRTLLGFLGVRQSPESWRVRKMHMPWWKWWPRLHSHSRTRSSRAPLSAIGEVFVGLVPKWAFCGLGGKGNKVKSKQPASHLSPSALLFCYKATAVRSPGLKSFLKHKLLKEIAVLSLNLM